MCYNWQFVDILGNNWILAFIIVWESLSIKFCTEQFTTVTFIDVSFLQKVAFMDVISYTANCYDMVH